MIPQTEPLLFTEPDLLEMAPADLRDVWAERAIIMEGMRMSRLRFVHAADLHLDSPFIGLSTTAPQVAGSLHSATFDAYERIINLCISERVDALLVAGDIYDGADRSLRAQRKFVDGL